MVVLATTLLVTSGCTSSGGTDPNARTFRDVTAELDASGYFVPGKVAFPATNGDFPGQNPVNIQGEIAVGVDPGDAVFLDYVLCEMGSQTQLPVAADYHLTLWFGPGDRTQEMASTLAAWGWEYRLGSSSVDGATEPRGSASIIVDRCGSLPSEVPELPAGAPGLPNP